MIGLIKDMVSMLLFLAACPFFRNKNVVLVYHSVDDMPASADPNKLSVPAELFKKQMEYVAGRRERVTVTFDDGHESTYKNAFPVIVKHGIRAVIFLTTDYIDGKISFDAHFGKDSAVKPLLWSQIIEMKDAGIRIGSHSCSHPDMASLAPAQARDEAILSRRRIKDMTGVDATLFSYPFGNHGSFTSVTDEILKEAGYSKTYANIMGMDRSATSPFSIKRIRIYSTDGMMRFKMKVAGAYNWVDSLVGLLRFTGRPGNT